MPVAARLAALVLLLASPALAQSLVPGSAPVDPRLVQGRTLKVEEANFSIEAPGDGWTWLTAPTAAPTMQAFACENAADALVFLVFVDRRNYPEMTEASARETLDGLASGMKSKGVETTNPRVEKSDIPVTGESFRLRLDASIRGRPLHSYGYAASPIMLYQLNCTTAAETEPEAFTRFVGSFKLLQSKEYLAGYRLGLRYGKFVPVVVLAIVIYIVTRRKKKRVEPV